MNIGIFITNDEENNSSEKKGGKSQLKERIKTVKIKEEGDEEDEEEGDKSEKKEKGKLERGEWRKRLLSQDLWSHMTRRGREFNVT